MNTDFCGYDASLATRNAWLISAVPKVGALGDIDISICEACGGTVKIIADTSDRSIEDIDTVREICDHIQNLKDFRGGQKLYSHATSAQG